jgi:hypothetical protein
LLFDLSKAMGLKEATAPVMWWEHYKNVIAYVLNAKRADVTGAVKRAFMRTYKCLFACIITQKNPNIPYIDCINSGSARSNKTLFSSE